jgi:tRNA nucleotidyltransferase/poly(A) polymerase
MYGKYNEPVRIHDTKSCDLLIELQDRIKKIEEENSALSLKDLAVNGKDLIALGIPAGKKLGAILNELFEAVLEDPGLNEKEKLLELAKKRQP